ncbi:MAG: bifunctional 2-polyprenyl-6-hydroxyphenol methylase/3-demethylubiquinol 3-O-methyltransferase UbiG [Gammaproteobacteria bacterium]
MSAQSHNADPQELQKFAALASRWWDPEGEFKPLHRMNPLRLDYIASCADLQGAQCLDVGCGGGLLSEGLANRGAIVTGIDLAEPSLNVARLHLAESGVANVQYQHNSAEQLCSTKQEEYDVVTCLEVLEHVPDPAELIAACSQLVRPGGHVFFSTINRNPKSFLLAIVAAEYILGLLPKGTHEYERLIKPSELARWGRAAGLHLDDLRGIHYDPFSETFSLANDVDVNYLMHFIRPDSNAA